MIGRRGFFKLVGAAVVGLSLSLRQPEKAIDLSHVEDADMGISIRFVREWDVVSSQQVNRFDVLMAQPYGFERIRG